ncbi:MAG TPA: hypothetical protein VNM43_11485 [Dehalococcoidia bacterium]|nr:hypothetical protein [Dehalococcoidia bacterium]
MAAALSFLAWAVVSCSDHDGAPKPVPESPTAAARSTADASRTAAAGTTLPVPPDRDLLDLARRLGRRSEPEPPARPTPEVGSRRTFWVTVLPPGAVGGEALPSMRQAIARLMAVSEHALFYWEEGFEPDETEAQRAADIFETEVRPALAPLFGDRPSDVDGDGRIVVLHADLGGGAGGYVADTDGVPAWAVQYGNEADMVYLDASFSPDSPSYEFVLAHEYQHLLHLALDPGEESWVNEGLSEFAGRLTVPGEGAQRAFLEDPRRSLDFWEGDGADYGKADLWFAYLAQRFGRELIASIARDQRDGVEGVRAALREAGADFEEVVADWATANYADQASGPYAYPDGDVSLSPTASIREGERLQRDVPQLAADYVAIEGTGPVRLTFEGATTTPLLDGLAIGDSVWWSNRGDGIDSRLTRDVDLTGVGRATLTFRTWFDIEEGWDYGYVEVSEDGGRTWTILSGERTTTLDPVGNAYGPGYTGASGNGDQPAWVDERIDLSPFAGKRILLRFEYVTDGGVYRRGWVIDDIRIPEIGLHDTGASADGWNAEGFVPVQRPLPQRFALRVVQGDRVTPVELDAANRATIDVDPSQGEAVLIVVALTGDCLAPAGYTLSAASG